VGFPPEKISEDHHLTSPLEGEENKNNSAGFKPALLNEVKDCFVALLLAMTVVKMQFTVRMTMGTAAGTPPESKVIPTPTLPSKPFTPARLLPCSVAT
jgi:hypothetical protein